MAYSYWYFIRLSMKGDSEKMTRVDEEKVCHSGLVAEIGEQLPKTGVEQASTHLFRLLVTPPEGEDLQAMKAVENSQRLEAWWKLLHLRVPPEHFEGGAVGGPVRQPSEDL